MAACDRAAAGAARSVLMCKWSRYDCPRKRKCEKQMR